MFNKNLENKNGVYIHSLPKNSLAYDTMWKRQYENQSLGIETWGANRTQRVFELFGNVVNFNGATVLDLCSGLGRVSAACIELNASHVVSADGSYNGLCKTRERFANLGFDESKHTQVQLDASQIVDCFQENYFDCVIHYYALQHMENYKTILSGINKILKPNGIIAFNYFTVGTTHFMTNLLRDVFLKHDTITIYNFLDEIGYIKGSSKTFHFKDLENLDQYEEKYVFVNELKELVQRYGSELVGSKFHFEDFTTPYLHNFSDIEIYEFTKNNNFKILKFDSGKIIAQKNA